MKNKKLIFIIMFLALIPMLFMAGKSSWIIIDESSDSIWTKYFPYTVDINDLTYNGYEQDVNLKIDDKYQGNILEPVFKYYSKNDNSTFDEMVNSKPKNVGDYKAEVYYDGDLIKSFEFKMQPAIIEVTTNNHSVIYGEALVDSNGKAVGSGVSFNQEDFKGLDDVSVIDHSNLSYSYTYVQYGDVGTYEITASGLDADNYIFAYKPGALTVNKRNVYIDWVDEFSWIYNHESHVPAANPIETSEPNTGVVEKDKEDFEIVVDGAEINKGEYQATIKNDYNNYNIVFTNDNPQTVDFEITERELTLDWYIDSNNIYTTGNIEYTYAYDHEYNAIAQAPYADITNDFEDDNISLSYEYSKTADFKELISKPTDAGTYYVRISSINNNDLGNYKLPDNVDLLVKEFTINPMQITVDWDEDSFLDVIYGCKEQEPIFELPGYFGSMDDVVVTYNGKANKPFNAGKYQVKITTNDTNYVFVENEEEFVIKKKKLNVIWKDYINQDEWKEIDSSLGYGVFEYINIPTSGVVLKPEFIDGEVYEADLTSDNPVSITATGIKSNANAKLDGSLKEDSSYYVATAVLSDDTNYEIENGQESCNFIIKASPLKGSIGNDVIETKLLAYSDYQHFGIYFIYNGVIQKPTSSFEGNIKDGDTVEAIVTTYHDINDELVEVDAINASTYIAKIVLTNDNYELSNPEECIGQFDINPIVVEIDYGQTEFVYNGLIQTPQVKFMNILSCDFGNVNPVVSLPDSINADSYTVIVTDIEQEYNNYALPEDSSSNYTILKKQLFMQANDNTIIYGDEAIDNGVSISGFVENEDINSITFEGTITYKYTYDKNDNSKNTIGEYTIIPTTTYTTQNYYFDDSSYSNGVLTVVQKEIEFSFDNLSLEYNGEVQTPDVTLGDLEKEDGITLNLTATGKYVSDNHIVSLVSITGSRASNYKLPEGLEYTYEIYPKYVSLSNFENNIVDFNGEEQLPTFYLEGIYLDDLDYVTYIYTDIDGNIITGYRNVGEYTVHLCNLDGSLAYNYTFHNYETGIDEVNGVFFKINPLDIEITWDTNDSFVYDGNEKLRGASLPELKGSDASYVTLSIEGKQIEVGNYTATASISGTMASNYNITNPKASFSIVPADPEVIDEIRVVYNQTSISGDYFTKAMTPANITFTGSYNTAGTITLNTDVLTIGTYNYEYTFTPDDTKNYNTVKGEVSITTYATITFEGILTQVVYLALDSYVSEPTDVQAKTGYDIEGWYNGSVKWDFATDTVTNDMTLTANYTAIVYSITYENVYDEVNSNPTSYTIETETIILEDLSREGYTFLGWTGEYVLTPTKGLSIEKGSIGNKVFIANWEAISYSIIYDLNGGQIASPNPGNYTIESEAFTLINPTKEGYEFAGWTGTNLSSATETVTINIGTIGNLEFIATWTPIEYTITYSGCDDATNSNPTSYTIESETITLVDPTKVGYDFIGWTTDGVTIPTKGLTINTGSTGNKKFTANWQEKSEFTITFIADGATVSTVTFNTNTVSIEVPEVPEKTGYTGTWGTYNLELESDQIVNAIYTAISYTITYESIVDATNSNPTSYTVESETITLTDLSKDGYTFLGWTTEGVTTPTKGLTITKGSTGNKEFTAVWQCTVEFLDPNGNSLKTINVIVGEAIEEASIPNPNIDMYKYSNYEWLDESGNAFDITTAITQVITLKANPTTIREYSVTIYYTDRDNQLNKVSYNLATSVGAITGTYLYNDTIDLYRQFRISDTTSGADMFYMTPVETFDWSLLVDKNDYIKTTVSINDTQSTLTIIVGCVQAAATSSSTASMANTTNLNVTDYTYYMSVEEAFVAMQETTAQTYLRIYGYTNGVANSNVVFTNTTINSHKKTINEIEYTFGSYTYNINNFTLFNSYEIGSNINIIMPYGKNDESSGYLKETTAESPKYSGKIQSILIINDGVTLTINGTLTIGATVVHTGTVGAHAVLMNNGTINAETGSKIYAYGYIKGKGTLDMKSGAYLADVLKIYDWAGGANSLGIYEDTKIFPTQVYSFNNVSCDLKINYGSSLEALYCIEASSIYQSDFAPLLGTNGLFKINSGYIYKTVEDTIKDTSLYSFTGSNQDISQKTVLEIYGKISDGAISITAGTDTIATSKETAMPVGMMKIMFKNGSSATLASNSYKFLPGSSLTIDAGASITISSGVQVLIYDEYIDAVTYTQAGTSTDWKFSYYRIHEEYYTAMAGDEEFGAQFIVNGDLVVNGNIGGKIKTSSTTGKIKLSNTSASIKSINSVAYEKVLGLIPSTKVTAKTDSLSALIFEFEDITKSGELSVAEAKTYYAHVDSNGNYGWFDRKLDISFDSNGGSTVSNTTIDTSASGVATITGLPTPTRQYYTFLGWYTSDDIRIQNDDTITTDISLTAKWELTNYTVVYNVVSETGETKFTTNTNPTNIKFGETITLVDPTIDGLIFNGWYINSECIGDKLKAFTLDSIFSYIQDTTINIYAKFDEEETYDINFIFMDSSIQGDFTISNITGNKTGSTVILNTESIINELTKNDKVTSYAKYFGGFYLSSDSAAETIESVVIEDSNIIIYIKFADKHTVQYEYDDGTQSGLTYYKPDQELTLTSKSKSDDTTTYNYTVKYTFDKWSVKSTDISGNVTTSTYSANTSIVVNSNLVITDNYTESYWCTITVSASNATVTITDIGANNNYTATTELPYGTTIKISVVYSEDNSKSTTIVGTKTNNSYNLDTEFSLIEHITVNASSSSSNCVAAGTLITLADGSQKKVEDLELTDILLVFDHETGTYQQASIIFIEDDGYNYYNVINLVFSDGTVTRIIYEHALFDLTLNKYVYITEANYMEYIGHEFAKSSNKGSYERVTLVDSYITNEYTGCYSLVTVYHLNYFIDGLFSIPGGIYGLFNIFEYDNDTLKYNLEMMQADIEKYGLYTYEDFEEYLPYEVYLAFPAEYFKVSVGKGMITFEEILTMIEKYLVKNGIV